MLESDNEVLPWSVERRFRVTEVFLALLWVSLPQNSIQGRDFGTGYKEENLQHITIKNPLL